MPKLKESYTLAGLYTKKRYIMFHRMMMNLNMRILSKVSEIDLFPIDEELSIEYHRCKWVDTLLRNQESSS